MLAALGNRLATVEASNDDGLTRRRLIQTLALVVVNVRDQLTSGCPVLHGGRMNAERIGHLLEREQALSTQAAKALLETVLLADVVDDEVAKPVRHAGTQASGVQDVGDLHVGVIVDQAIDFGDHCRMGLSQLYS